MTAKKKGSRPEGAGRKGGTRFPQEDLSRAVGYAKKLVSKTHSGPQPENNILLSVFNNKGPAGKVRVSVLKQYGLMKGTSKAYEATQLARDITVAPPDELSPLLHKAFMQAPVFKSLFESFQNDTTSLAKLQRQASVQKVHVDSLSKCVDVFVKSLVFAGLGSNNADQVTLKPSALAPTSGDPDIDDKDKSDDGADTLKPNAKQEEERDAESPSRTKLKGMTNQSSDVRVNITIDPTMDPEKLEKHLSVLKKYGVI